MTVTPLPSGGIRHARGLLLALTLVFGFLVAIAQITSYDVWALLAGGRYIALHGLPETDPFSFTAAGRPWVNHSWLSQLLLYLAYDRLGRVSVILLKGILAAATLGLAWAPALARSGSPPAAALATGLVALAAAPWWHLRPQLFTYLAWAAFLYLYARWRAGAGWALGALVPVMALWVNFHAGFALGLAALGIWAAGLALERFLAADSPGDEPQHPALRPFVMAAGLVALATLANPWGWRAFVFPLRMTTSRHALGASIDWYSPNFLDPALAPALVAVVLLMLGLAWAPARPRPGEALLLAFLLAASLRSARNLPLFLLAATPVVAQALATVGAVVVDRWPRARALGAGLALALLAGGSLGVLAWTRPLQRNPFVQELSEARYPVEVVRFVRAHRPPPPLFNAYLWAGYELWALPEYPVFIDNRFEVYPPAVIDDYLEVTHVDPRWEEALGRWHIRTLLVGRGSALARALEGGPRWVRVFQGREAAIFVRRDDPATAALLERLGLVGPAPRP
jgi:hypothetical protein